jgi:Mg2+-importing ATPase
VTIAHAAQLPVEEVLDQLKTGSAGLASGEAARRLAAVGPNAVRTHEASGWSVLARQLGSPILILLAVTAGLSLFLGDATNSIVIGVILLASVGLGFVNEFRAERAAEALHARVTHLAAVLRDGILGEVRVTALVPGDVVHLAIGAVVPADMRLLTAKDLLCDESILTGESLPVSKDPAPVRGSAAPADLTSCLFMGTVVQSGSCTAVVVATGGRAEFGRIALGLGERQPQTEFQLGLKRFSFLLLQVAVILTTLIFVANLLLQRPVIESLLFSLAIAVGITPQLLPAVVSTSLATGTRQLAKRKVLVKRLVCIEDLGDMDVLVTDKTGTLTEGRISFTAALPARDGVAPDFLFTLGLLATEAEYTEAKVSTVGLNPLDAALWASADAAGFEPGRYERLDVIDFDHLRRRTSVLVREQGGAAQLVSKGSPEDVLALCADIPAGVQAMLDEQFNAGSRVVAVASRPAAGLTAIGPADEKDLVLEGLLVFLDRPKANARASLDQLEALGITVKIATGDNAKVAEKVCDELGVLSGGTLTGAEVETFSDAELAAAAR